MPAPPHTETSLPIVVLVGPTAGGKTGLALALARLSEVPGECVCADSMQVYRGMDIGTAKPTAEERAVVPHHLLDLRDPSDDGFSVERWLELAESAIADIRRRGRRPIVVGGTNLYVRALLEGLLDGPEPDPLLRAELESRSDAALREELERVDPTAAERIHPRDRRRTIRALEVFRAGGVPLSTLQTQWSADLQGSVRRDALVVGIDWPVEAINRRINERVRTMMASGFLDEVRRLRADAGSSEPLGRQARDAVGYRELLEHCAGKRTLEEAVEAIKIRSRQYAKQQRTWLRRFRRVPGSLWIDAATQSEPEWPRLVAERLRALPSPGS